MNSIFALLTIGFVLPTHDIVIAGIALAIIILVAALLLFRSTGKGKAGKKAAGGGTSDWQQVQPGMPQAQPGMNAGWGQPAGNAWGASAQQPGGWDAMQAQQQQPPPGAWGQPQQQQSASAGGWGAPAAQQQPGAWGQPQPQQQAGWDAMQAQPQQPGVWGQPQQQQQQQPQQPAWGAPAAQQQPSAWNQQPPQSPQSQPAANAWNPSGQQQQPATSWGTPSPGQGNQQPAWDATSLAQPQQPQQQQVPAWGMPANSAAQPQQAPQAPTAYGGSGSGQSWGQQASAPAQQGGWGQPFQQAASPSPAPTPGAGANPAMPWQQQNGMAPEAATMFSADSDKTMLRTTGPQGTLGFVRVEEGKEPGRVYEIRKNELSIGRSRESDIFLEDLAVSRLHAKILNMGNGVYALKDEGSANGTKVNGQVVNKYQNYPLQEGDKVQLGQTVLVFSRR
jgi:hypothetical protein